MKGFNETDIDKVLMVRELGGTPSNAFKLNKLRFNKDIGKNCFINRVVDEWHRFDSHVTSANTMDTSKIRLD